MKAKLRELSTLFLTFFRIGLFTFGGGYAMISLIENECVHRHRWLTEEEMLQMTAIAESTPGPIAINCATFVGYRQRGVIGASMTTLGVVLPSFVIISVIAFFLKDLLEIPVVAAAFRGICIAVSLLILRVAIRLFKKAKKTPLFLGLFLSSVLLSTLKETAVLSLSPILLILGAALFGTLTVLAARRADHSDTDSKGGGEA